MTRRPRLLFVVTEDWYFWSHRRALAAAARDAGYDVAVATRPGRLASAIADAGLRLIPLDLPRGGRNPLGELRSIAALARIYRQERPDIVHHVAAKPVMYGALASLAAPARAGTVNAIAGFGHAFSQEGSTLAPSALATAFRWALGRATSSVIVQNPEDQRFVIERCRVAPSSVTMIRGCGVDLAAFAPAPEPAGLPVVMFAGRLLATKGVPQLVEAARLVNRGAPRCRVVLVGEPDSGNRAAIAEDQLRQWQADGTIEWWGRRDDMARTLAESTIFALPSMYGEGVPKALLEAAAVGRPLVATDAPGCREIVRDGDTGLLVRAGDVADLAEAIGRLLDDPAARARMGARARRLVEEEFSEADANARTLALYARHLASARTAPAAGASAGAPP